MQDIIESLYTEIWNHGNLDQIEVIIHPSYTIHRDSGDQWEKQTLDHSEYEKRLQYTRNAFPDINFVVERTVREGSLISVLWSATGTQLGELQGLPITGKKLSFHGQTIYELTERRLSGHWQVMDRLGFFQQLQGT